MRLMLEMISEVTAILNGTVHVYQNRFEKLDSSFRELEDRILDAQVEWGDKFKISMVPLRTCRAELLIAIRNHVAMKDPNNSGIFDQLRPYIKG